jgi:hypothetical protein
MIGNWGERVVDSKWRVGTSHLAGHGRAEPKTQILKLGGEAIMLDGRTTPFTRLSGCEILLQKQTNVPGWDIGTPTDAADVGTLIVGVKGADYGDGGIRGQSLVVNQLFADTELVGLVEVVLRPESKRNLKTPVKTRTR